MLVRLLGRSIEIRAVHSWNAESPMVIRLLGRSIDFRAEHWLNAKLAMETTPSGTTTWPFVSGGYRQSAATPPIAMSSRRVTTIFA